VLLQWETTTAGLHTHSQCMPFVIFFLPSHPPHRKYPDEPSNQWHTSATHQKGPLTRHMTPPFLAAESLQMSFSSQKPLLLSCRWLCDKTLCEFTGTLEELKVHCKTSHFSGPQNAQFQCRWEACAYYKRSCPTVHVMRRDCMWRHTREVHLGMKRST
jgi:hypothetical protein